MGRIAKMADQDASHSALLAQFTNITGVDAERATFFLESSAWNLDMALGSFYEEQDDGDEPMVAEPSGSAAAPAAAESQSAPKSQNKSRIATFSSMQDDDSSEEEGQAFYAGGSERSGQQVLGPPRKKQNADEFVKNMFQSAKEHGAETVEDSGPSKPKAQSVAFRGTGYKLGDNEAAGSESVRGLPMPHTGPQQVDVVLKLWKKGFSVNDGPLRDY